MARLSEAGAGMMAALWPGAVMPNSFSQLARWLEAGLERLHARRVSAARAGAEMALRFVYWYPDLALDRLMGQQASAERQLHAEAGCITDQGSYTAGFTIHDEFQPERTDNGGVILFEDFVLLLDDSKCSSEETCVYRD